MRILVFFFLLLTVGCEFQYSPYVSAVKDLKSNKINLAAIRAQEDSTADVFKIAFISDTHNYYKDLSRLIKTINQNGPYAFVVVCGDVTNIALLEEFEETLDRLRSLHFPFLVLPGNHDLVANGQRLFLSLFGDLDLAFEFKNALFILHNNNNWETHGTAPSFAWVEQELRTSSAEFKVLAGHVPPRDPERFPPEFVEGWRELMNLEAVNYVFSGHRHGPAETSFGNAVDITIGTVAARTYVELLISPGAIDHKRIDF